MDQFYLSKEFARLARRNGLEDEDLREAVDRAERGLVDADLGGLLIKQRVARRNQGRSSGFRTIIAYRRGTRAVFLHIIEKSRQATLSPVELETYQDLAKLIDRLTDAELDEQVKHAVGAGLNARRMMRKRKVYRSDALRSAHSAAADLYAVGSIDKETMRRFDKACLTDIDELKPMAIKRIREAAKMSQTVFALTLNVTPSLVSQWERGEKKPSGPSLKLLNLADKKGVEAIL